MADEENGLKHSSCLFLKDDGSVMRFYIRPCEMKAKIRPLVEHGGGVISSKLIPDAIKVAEPDSNRVGYFSTDFIFDSVKKNICQNLDDYRIGVPERQPSPTSTTTNTIVSVKKALGKSGRVPYTPEEDQAMLDYVKNHKSSAAPLKGNTFWKKMEQKKITKHTWQSMKDHYLKYLRSKKKSKFKSVFVTNQKDSSVQVRRTNRITVTKKPGNRLSIFGSSSKKAVENTIQPIDDVSDRNKAEDGIKTPEGYESDGSEDFDANLLLLAENGGKLAPGQDDSNNNRCTENQGDDELSDCEVTSSQDLKQQARKHKKNAKDDLETLKDSRGDVASQDTKKTWESPSKIEGNDKLMADKACKQQPTNRAETSKRRLRNTESKDNVSSTPTKQRRQAPPPISGDSLSSNDTPQQSPSFDTMWSAFKKIQDMLDMKIPYAVLMHALLVASGSTEGAENYLKCGELEEDMDPWSVEEDEVLFGQDTDAICKLKRKRGRAALLERIAFLEHVKST